MLIIAGAITLAVVMIVVSAFRPLSTLELVLWQVVSLALGLYGSYRFGQNAARDAARDIIRPHARSAIRRALSWQYSLQRLSRRIQDFQADSQDQRLDVIQAIIHEQIPTGSSVIEDWRDIAPGDVDEVIEQWPRRLGFEENGNSD